MIDREESAREKHIHDLIIKNDDIKKDMLSLLNLEADLTKLELIHEDKYINGIYADFTLVYNDSIRAIIECKAGDIGVTDYVRGIGQVLQYEYFYENNISPKGWKYYEFFNSVLLIPSSAFKNNSFNLGKFKYPDSTLIFEINESSNVIRKISSKEIQELSTVNEDSLTSISQYYVRDNRFFEIYMLLRYACLLKLKGVVKINRKEAETELRKTNTINNGNWRNAWITASSLGFIDSNNSPTSSGIKIGMLEYEDFLILIYDSYVKPYIDLIMNYFNINENNLSKPHAEINDDIRMGFSNRDVLFLTQSNGRYLSSWLNILRDDFGCIQFTSKSNNRTINYNPFELNNESLKNKIKEHSVFQTYIDRLKEII